MIFAHWNSFIEVYMFDFIYKISNTPLQIVCLIGILAIGVFFLVKFCDIFVDSASAIAKKMKISPLVIGLTIVAMGTSCPELAVSVSDSISVLSSGGNANVALGNVVGSNICNLLLVLGLSAIFTPLYVKKSVCKREFPFLIGISVLLTVFGIFFGLGDKAAFAITRWEAIIFVVLMVTYMVMIVKFAKKDQAAELANADLSTQGTQNSSDALKTETDEASAKEKPFWLVIVLCVLGIAGIIAGGEMVVCGAKGLAVQAAGAIGLDHDLTEALVGLTIVAVGTSLPELVTSVIAAKKGENELAIGNVVGSNVFNILFILGIAGTVNPLTTGPQIIVDLAVMLVATVVVFIFCRKQRLEKWQGYVMLGMYLGYLTYLIVRTLTA